MYTVEQYANTLYEVLQDTHPKDHKKVIDNFISILKENGADDRYEDIIKEVEKLEQKKQNAKQVELITASPLGKEEEEKITRELNKQLGNNIELRKVVDEGIISGLVIKVDDVVIDGSVKRRIEKLGSDIK